MDRSGASKRLRDNLAGLDLATLTEDGFFDALRNTKPPLIFAESAVAGDGSDWNLTELAIPGEISIAVPVMIFDNGHYSAPVPHAEPFKGTWVIHSRRSAPEQQGPDAGGLG